MSEQAAIRPNGHPWLSAFRDSPQIEFENFLRGYAKIAPYDQASVSDAARLLFSSLDSNDALIRLLDDCVINWLKEARFVSLDFKPAERERFLRQIADGLKLISLVRLAQAASTLREEFDEWYSWAESLSTAGQTDVLAEFLSTLALTQGIVKTVFSDPFQLEPFWLRMCQRLGTAYPDSYLEIALLGLRYLPERDTYPSERPWMSGLGLWAVARKPSVAEFAMKWTALQILYPRAPKYWERAVAATLNLPRMRKLPDEISEYWASYVGLDAKTVRDDTNSQVSRGFAVSVRDVTQLLASISEPIATLKPKIDQCIKLRTRLAEVTGDAFHLTRTSSRIGFALLGRIPHGERYDRAKLAITLAQISIRWNPDDQVMWALWLKALYTAGQYSATEAVGWEALRRFPEEVRMRSQFAKYLTGIPNKQKDVEDLMRETILRFPDDAVDRTQLALFLMGFPARHFEAETILLETIRLFPDDPFPPASLAEMYIADGRLADAATCLAAARSRITKDDSVLYDVRARLAFSNSGPRAAKVILEEGLSRHPHDGVLIKHLNDLEIGNPLKLTSLAFRDLHDFRPEARDTIELAPSIVSSARLRRVLTKIRVSGSTEEKQKELDALNELENIRSFDANASLAIYLREQTNHSKVSTGNLSAFGTAIVEALRKKKLDQVDLRPRTESDGRVLDVAKVYLFSDIEAAHRTAIWLRTSGSAETRALTALRSLISTRIGVVDPEHLAEKLLSIIPSNQNVRDDLLDVVFVPEQYPLAA